MLLGGVTLAARGPERDTARAMSQENVEIVRRSFERFLEGRPAWELYAEDFRLVNLRDAPWQPAPGAKGLQEWLDFTSEVTEEWGVDLAGIEALDSERVLIVGRLWAKFRATGIREETPMVLLVTLANGKLARSESFYTREEALEAAGLSE
jgi:ketosteroid isomerase-like protein